MPHNNQAGYTPGPTSHGELTLAHDGLKPNVTRFSILSKLRYSWGRTPVLRPASTSASSPADMAGAVARGAGPGGPAQTWRSAPQLPHYSRYLKNEWHHLKWDRKRTRLNSSHLVISYAVFCLKK